jgi:hypothetical protein
VALTAPAAFNGDNTSFVAGQSCSTPSTPDCPGLGGLYFSFNNEPKTCPPSGYNFSVNIDRTKASPSNSAAPVGSWFVDYTDVSNSNNDCDSWNGSVTFFSDVPNWKVGIDVTCSSGPSVHLAGTFSGTVN